MVRLIDRVTGESIGDIREQDLEVLQEILEDEQADATYQVNANSLEFLSQAGLSSDAMELLTRALSGREHLDLTWQE